MLSSLSSVLLGSATWQAWCCGSEESAAFRTPQTGADSPGLPFDVWAAIGPSGRCGTSLFCQVVSQERCVARAQLDSHSVPGKWVCEKENIFFFDCLSPCHFAASALCFLTFPPLYLPPFSFCLSIFSVFPFFSPRHTPLCSWLHITRYSCSPSSLPSFFLFTLLSFATVQCRSSFASCSDFSGGDNSLCHWGGRRRKR